MEHLQEDWKRHSEDTLYLTIKKKWFDMIISGEKKEEYREPKQYWMYRICRCGRHYPDKCGQFDFCGKLNYVTPGKFNIIDRPHFDTVTFVNGYNKKSRRCKVELLKVTFGEGKLEWGAELNKKYLILSLGNIISKKI